MKIETIILAGGKSSRMGEDKALLTIKGKPFITYICEQVVSFSQNIYIVSPWVEKYQNLVPTSCVFISESQSFSGPLSAFADALEHVTSEWILLLACDLPYLNLSTFHNWIENLSTIDQDNQKAIAFLAPNKKGWECLAGFYHRRCLDSLQKYLETEQKSFQDWLKNEQVIPMTIVDYDIFFNCNTPEEYQKIKVIPNSKI